MLTTSLGSPNRVKLTIATTDYDHFRDFRTGVVQAEGIEHTWLTLGHHEIFSRFTFNREWDVTELSFAKFAAQVTRKDPDIIGIPVVCSRLFRFGSFYVNKKSKIKTAKDLKGKKIGYTNPRSTSQALAILLLQAAGLKPDDAELVRTGGFGEGVAALDLGLIDVAAMAEPVWSKYKAKYRAVAIASEILPPLDNVVGVTTAAAMATRGDFVRAVIRARRKAVEFMHANPDEAGDIVAKHYNLERDVARSAVQNLTASRTQDVPYWGSGQFYLEGMKRMVEVQRMVGALSGDIDLSKMIDTRFLPDDIKTVK